MLTRRSPDLYVVAASSPLPYSPFTLWHLLSLDAPTVAVLWTLFPARLAGVPLPWATPAAMALAVWALYAADRLLDTRHLASPAAHAQPHDLEPRHLFHLRHRAPFLAGIGLSTLLLATLLPHLAHPAIHLYLVEAAWLAGYFLLIHAAAPGRPRRLPKELLVGIFFAAATFIPTISRAPTIRPALLPYAALFAALCSLNCLYIYAWEHPAMSHPHPLTRALLTHLPQLSAALLIAALALTAGAFPLYAWACALSVALLVGFHRARLHFGPLTLRTAADAALLSPLLFFLIL